MGYDWGSISSGAYQLPT